MRDMNSRKEETPHKDENDVWVNTGHVNYKLRDQEFICEEWLPDEVMQKKTSIIGKIRYVNS